jgi:hypothetical protein
MNTPIVQYFDNKIQNCDFIPVDKPCCIMFHGYKTIKPNITKHEIEKYDIFEKYKVNLYGIYYQTKFSTNAEAILTTNTLITPVFHNYINSIFNVAILPRICNSQNQKLPVEEVVLNMSKITVFTHCYGVFVADSLIKTLDKNLKKLDYKPEEISRIHKQMVIITQSSPYLLHDKPSTIVNFASFIDKAISYKNIFPNIDRLTFVNDYNLIVTPNFYNKKYLEHIHNHQPKEIEHWLWTIKDQSILSDNGKETVKLLKTIFNNSVQRPEINGNKDLFVNGNRNLFDTINNINPKVSNVNLKIFWNLIKYSITKKY